MLVEGIIIIAILAMAKNGGEDTIDELQAKKPPTSWHAERLREQDREKTQRFLRATRTDRIGF